MMNKARVISPHPKVYLSGPMTGLPDFNFPHFNEVAGKLREHGFFVMNPAENNDQRKEWIDYMLHDIAWIKKEHPEYIYLLRGFEFSKGSAIERIICASIGAVEIYER